MDTMENPAVDQHVHPTTQAFLQQGSIACFPPMEWAGALLKSFNSFLKVPALEKKPLLVPRVAHRDLAQNIF